MYIYIILGPIYTPKPAAYTLQIIRYNSMLYIHLRMLFNTPARHTAQHINLQVYMHLKILYKLNSCAYTPNYIFNCIHLH